MEWIGQFGGGAGGDIVHLAVGDQHGAGDAIGRYIGERFGQRPEKCGAAIANAVAIFRDRDNSNFQVFVYAELGAQFFNRIRDRL